MKTLVIHPFDHSTQYLSTIYEGKGFTVLSTECSRKQLKAQIKAHDRIIMMGHGDEHGLFGHGRYVITKQNLFYLKQKQCVFIWCNADVFVKHHGLTGLYTGMIISEWEEAILYCMHSIKQEWIDTSNTLFAQIFREYLDMPGRLEFILAMYQSDTNPVIQFNSVRIFEK